MRRPVTTGPDAVDPLALCVDVPWRCLRDSGNGIALVTRLDVSAIEERFGFEVWNSPQRLLRDTPAGSHGCFLPRQ